MLILRNDDLIDLLTYDTAWTALATTLHEQAAGKVDLPARLTVDAEDGAWLRLMPAIHNTTGLMGFKSMNVTPGVGVRSFIALIEIASGAAVALLDGDYITALRTAVTAAIATELFAPIAIESMALLGSGAMAAAVLRALVRVRQLPRVDVYSPDEEHRLGFARRMSEELGIEVRAVGSAREAIRPANLITGAYRARNMPAIELADIGPHVHINSLSSVRPQAREVAADVWRACSCVFVDHRAGVAQSGDGLSVLRDHPFDLERWPELWEIVRDGNCRAGEDGRTMYKSVGAASQDIALAAAAFRAATEGGVGEEIPEFPALRTRT